jgi:hypothetical protein
LAALFTVVCFAATFFTGAAFFAAAFFAADFFAFHLFFKAATMFALPAALSVRFGAAGSG